MISGPQHAHEMDDLADDPAYRALGFARLTSMPDWNARSSMPAMGSTSPAPWFPRSRIGKRVEGAVFPISGDLAHFALFRFP
jgi:hypothetical protein